MNRIDAIFKALRAGNSSSTGRKAIMPFLTVGDPTLAATQTLLPSIEKAGASICELGIPFSDPVADGPVIQDSMNHALAQGLRVRQVFDMVSAVRSCVNMGLVAMVSYSLVHRWGPQSFITAAASAGIDGFIFPDLPVEESADIRRWAAEKQLTCSFLVSPTTPDHRVEQIVGACTGFIYVLARAGVTGEQSQLPVDLTLRVSRLRQMSDLPIAVGFGVSSAQHVRQVVSVADAAIVGSAIMRRIAPLRSADMSTLTREVAGFVQELATGLV